jgi:hypothetical protein
MRRLAFSCSLHVWVGLVLFSSVAAAQGTGGKWEVEVHGGVTQAQSPTGGDASLPDPAAPFRTLDRVGTSRRVPSWYFGDGAVLLNQVNTAFAISPRITPLDPVLQSSVDRQGGGLFGVRVSRQLNARFSAEFSFDYSRSQLEMTDATLSAIEASRASFISAWNGVMGTAPILFQSPVVTSTGTIVNHQGRQALSVGALAINLTRPGKFVPFAIVGAGVVSHLGETPSVTVAGNYQFLFGGVVLVNESDTVTVRYASPGRALVGVFGGGFKYAMSSRSGFRVDARVHLNNREIDTLVDATPSVLTSTPGGTASRTTPSLQFTSNPPLDPGSPSTLSGPAIVGFKSFAGSGVQSQIGVTAGWFWRF